MNLDMAERIKVRFPPSPTGYCHIGTARMALLNYAFAKKHGGTIVFRSEDTDKERSKREYEDDIIEQLQWLGFSWDEFYRTSELLEDHKSALQTLINADKAYISLEESKKEPGKQVEVVRLRNPGKIITFTDIVRGDITFDTKELGDLVIARAIDDPLYHFAVVVDDANEGVTHVIRGEDHISNTPRHILIQEALGYPRPQYAHFPLHLNADRSKMSKRSGDVAVRVYREKGFLRDALVNYLAVVGWTAPSGKEILSLEDIISEFELTDLHKSGGIFDMEKLRWYNRQYLLREPDADFAKSALDVLRTSLEGRVEWNGAVAQKVAPLIKERVNVWEDLREQVREGEYDFFFADPMCDPASIPGKKNTPDIAKQNLIKVKELLENIPDAQFEDAERLKAGIWPYAESAGRAAVLWPLRYALSGRERSPDPFVILSIIGKESALRRVEAACASLAV